MHGLIQIGPLDTQPFASKARASQAHTIVALIKGLQSSPAKESQSADITDDLIFAPQEISFSNLFFLNLRTADPTINGKIFCLAKTATFFDNYAVRLLTSSILRK